MTDGNLGSLIFGNDIVNILIYTFVMEYRSHVFPFIATLLFKFVLPFRNARNHSEILIFYKEIDTKISLDLAEYEYSCIMILLRGM